MLWNPSRAFSMAWFDHLLESKSNHQRISGPFPPPLVIGEGKGVWRQYPPKFWALRAFPPPPRAFLSKCWGYSTLHAFPLVIPRSVNKGRGKGPDTRWWCTSKKSRSALAVCAVKCVQELWFIFSIPEIVEKFTNFVKCADITAKFAVPRRFEWYTTLYNITDKMDLGYRTPFISCFVTFHKQCWWDLESIVSRCLRLFVTAHGWCLYVYFVPPSVVTVHFACLPRFFFRTSRRSHWIQNPKKITIEFQLTQTCVQK